MNESTFTRGIHKKLPPEIYAYKSSDRFSGGIPDAWYSGDGGDLWVEYKLVKGAKASVKPNLSKLQKIWLERRLKEGRTVAVAVAVDSGVLLYENLEWESSKSAKEAITVKDYLKWIESKCLKSTHQPS